MHRSSNRLKRFAVGLLAVLQLAVPLLVAVADATVAARAFASRPQVHVEDYGRRDAVAAHPDNCALCQLIGLSSDRTRPPLLVLGARAGDRPVGTQQLCALAAGDVRLPAWRAPPVNG